MDRFNFRLTDQSPHYLYYCQNYPLKLLKQDDKKRLGDDFMQIKRGKKERSVGHVRITYDFKGEVKLKDDLVKFESMKKNLTMILTQ